MNNKARPQRQIHHPPPPPQNPSTTSPHSPPPNPGLATPLAARYRLNPQKMLEVQIDAQSRISCCTSPVVNPPCRSLKGPPNCVTKVDGVTRVL